MIQFQYETIRQAIDATSGYYDLLTMGIRIDFRKIGSNGLAAIKKSIKSDMANYAYARQRAVELGAEGMERFPEDISAFLKREIKELIETHSLMDKIERENLNNISSFLEYLESNLLSSR